MELAFRRFDYREVTVLGFTISYLFVVFSVRRLDLPRHCYCENDWAAIREATAVSAAVQEVAAPAASAEEGKTRAASVKTFADLERNPGRPTMNDNIAPTSGLQG